MRTFDSQEFEQGIAMSRDLTKRRMQSAFAMVAFAALAYVVASMFTPNLEDFELGVAAATGLTVGVWCVPEDYRTRNGSIALAVSLIVGMWTIALVVLLTSLFN